MITGIGSIVIYVNDIVKATTDYQALGFNVAYSNVEVEPRLYKSVIPFSDGSSLELVSGDVKPHNNFLLNRYNLREGLINFGCFSSALAEDIKMARQKGLSFSEIKLKTEWDIDGKPIESYSSSPSTIDLPFICSNVTARSFQVLQADIVNHPNGFVNVGNLSIVVDNLEASKKRYEALLGVEGEEEDGAICFKVGNTWIVLISPKLNSEEEQMYKQLKIRGEGPFRLTFRGTKWASINPNLTHSVEISFQFYPPGSLPYIAT